jgi:hypothetical protein
MEHCVQITLLVCPFKLPNIPQNSVNYQPREQWPEFDSGWSKISSKLSPKNITPLLTRTSN